MPGRPRAHRPALITSAAPSHDEELNHRHRRYAIMAAIFVGCFTAGALLYRDTVLALVLCGIAMVTLLAAVFAANVRSRPSARDHLEWTAHDQRVLPTPRRHHRPHT